MFCPHWAFRHISLVVWENMAASLWVRCIAKSRGPVFSFTKRNRLLFTSQKVCTSDQELSSERGEPLESDKNAARSGGESALAGFARVLEKVRSKKKYPDGDDEVDDTVRTEHTTFAAMLRHSKLMQLGGISGRMVVGRVIEVVGDDLYIDIGGKFHCVCPRPKLNSERYHWGTKVKVQVNDLEMSSSFLGSDKHVTLLEADATLIGLRRQSQVSAISENE